MSRVEDILQKFDNDLQRENWSDLLPTEKNALRSDLINLLKRLKEINDLDDHVLRLYNQQNEIKVLQDKNGELRRINSVLKKELSSFKKVKSNLERRFANLQKSSDLSAFIVLQKRVKSEERNTEALAKKFDKIMEELDLSLEQHGLAFSPLTGRLFKPNTKSKKRKQIKHFQIEAKKQSPKKILK